MHNQTKAYIYAALAILFWSSSASAFKLCLASEHLDLPVPVLLLGASLASSTVLLAALLLTGRARLLGETTARDLLRSAFLGLLSPFLYYLVLFHAYSLLRAQEAQPLNFVWPLVLVVLSAPLLGQTLKLRDIAAIIVSFFGVLVISTEGRVWSFKLTDPLGVALATGSSIPWALYWIYNLKDRRDELARLVLNFACASVYALVLVLVSGSAASIGFAAVVGLTYVGLFEMGITFLLWLKALRLSRSSAQVTSLVYLVPFLSLVVIRLVLGERILPSTVLGAAFIVGGIILQKLRIDPRRPSSPAVQ